MKEEIINKLLEELKNNIPKDYVRSCDTSDGVGYYEIDEDSWQYQVYHYIQNLQSQLKAKEEVIKEIKEHCEIEINASNHYLENHKSQKELCHKVAHQRILEILSKGENK